MLTGAQVATLNVTKRGRRYTICPSCSVLSIPASLVAHTCPFCNAIFSLVAPKARPQRKSTSEAAP